MEWSSTVTRDYGWHAAKRSSAEHESPSRGGASRVTAVTTRAAAEQLDWTRRHLDLGAEVVILTDAIARAIDAGDRSAPLLAIRRSFGGIHSVRDALFDLSSDTSCSSEARIAYVDCAHWWIAQLVRSARAALSHDGAAMRAGAIREAATFASLYALAQLVPLAPLGEADAIAHRLVSEVQWLTWQLEDLCED